MTGALREPLRAGAKALGLALQEPQLTALLDFLALLHKWNQVYNLTAVRDPHEMLAQHLLDSLAAVAPLARQLAGCGAARPRVLDVGSGGGLPGVVFAICCPHVDVTCVDAVAKKAAFVQQVSAQLPLANLHGMHARVQDLAGPYDVVCSRAFASLADFTAWSHHLLAPQAVWLAMKGRRPDDEIAALPADVRVFHVEPLAVPGLAAERCLVWLRPAP